MIAVVNYGVGNIAAISTIYRQLSVPACVASKPEELRAATRIVLPGVGAFDWAMSRLNESGMRETLDEQVMANGVPVLGICVGMQMMAKRSDEGVLDGLGWVDAEVKKFRGEEFGGRLRLPHMGWNDVLPANGECLFRGLESEARFYFLHSYYFVPNRENDTLAMTEYGRSYTSSVRCGNVYGVQFHPEKSHRWGVQLLRNFAEV